MPQPAFVNEAKLFVPGEVDARIALLQQRVEAGVILGDHTYSHAEFNQLTVEQFEDEIVKGDVITRRLMQSRQPYQLYFRHPETHTGDNQAKKEAINADCLNDLLQRLEARGYRFVTLDEAMSDPAYRTRDTLVTKSGPTWLWRWMKSKGMAIGFRGDPDPPEWPEVKK